MTDKPRDKVEPITRIVQATGLEPAKICEVVYLYLAAMHRIMIVDEKGPTAAAMETCFSFGADAAFHLIGLYASNDHYHDRDDDAGEWNEVAMRFIPQAHREGCERISPWFSERTPARASLDKYLKKRARASKRTTSIRATRGSGLKRKEGAQDDLFTVAQSPAVKSSARHSARPRGKKSPISSERWSTDPLAERFAAEHKRFLEENNPSVLRGLSDPTSYLSSVGQTAADMLEHLMVQAVHDPEVRKLSGPEWARELRSRQLEAEEVIRHDVIFQPLPESHTRPYED